MYGSVKRQEMRRQNSRKRAKSILKKQNTSFLLYFFRIFFAFDAKTKMERWVTHTHKFLQIFGANGGNIWGVKSV